MKSILHSFSEVNTIFEHLTGSASEKGGQCGDRLVAGVPVYSGLSICYSAGTSRQVTTRGHDLVNQASPRPMKLVRAFLAYFAPDAVQDNVDQ